MTTIRKRINQKLVDSRCAARGDETIWDSDLKGFGIRIRPSGRISYFVKYRMKDGSGRTRKPTIGTHPATRCGAAREAAARLIAAAQAGHDITKPTAPQGLLTSDFWLQYQELHVQKALKPSSAKAAEDIASRLVMPALGSKRLQELTPIDLERFHKGLSDTPYQANRALALVSSMFNKAVEWQQIEALPNPCALVKKFREKARERFLSPEETDRLLKTLESHRMRSPQFVGALEILLLTGLRKSEVITLEWTDVDTSTQTITLQDSKTGRRAVPISRAVVKALTRLKGTSNSKYVFPGRGAASGPADRHIVGLQKFWAIVRAEAGLMDVRVHDLRHTFASVAVQNGIGLPVVGGLLGHRSASTTMRYAHLADTALRDAAAKTTDAILAKNQ